MLKRSFCTRWRSWIVLTLYAGLWASNASAQNVFTAIIDHRWGDVIDPASDHLMNVVWENYATLDSVKAPKAEQSKAIHQLALGMLNSRRGDFKEADQHWQSVLSSSEFQGTGRSYINLMYAYHLVRCNRIQRAARHLQEHSIEADSSVSPMLRARWCDQAGYIAYLEGSYQQSEAYYDRALVLCNEGGVAHPWYSEILNHRGLLAVVQGEFAEAEVQFQEAMSVAGSIGIGAGQQLANAKSNYGDLLRVLGDYEGALSHLKTAQKFYQQNQLYPDLAILESNMAAIYDGSDSLDLANYYYEKSLRAYAQIFETKNITYAIALSNYAGLLEYQEHYSEALMRYEESLALIDSIQGRQNINYTTIASNFSLLCESLGDLEKATQMLREALSIREQVLGPFHPRYVDLLYNLGGVLSQSNPDSALNVFATANDRQLDLIHYLYSTFDEETRLSYFDDIELEFERYYSVLLQHGDPIDWSRGAAFSAATKSLALEYSRNIRVTQSKDTALDDWLALRDSFANVVLLTEEERQDMGISLPNLLADIKTHEKRQVRSILSRTKANSKTQFRSLESDDLIIDVVRFENFKAGRWTDTILYGAFVYDAAKTNIGFIKLATELQLQNIMEQGNSAMEFEDQIQRFSDLLILPLHDHLQTRQRLIYCPTGLLHQIPIEGLRKDNRYVQQCLDVITRGELRTSLEDPKELEINQAFVLGGLEYDSAKSGSDAGYFARLPGTKAELEFLRKELGRQGVKSALLQGSSATRSQLTSTIDGGEYDLIHIATHGFAFDHIPEAGTAQENIRNRILSNANSLHRTGLILSHANDYWFEKQGADARESILSAYQLANLGLSNTELVFLSACRSGRGDIHSVEGVFGLPRALLLAGAKYVIYTLWDVEDVVTQDFVISFYGSLFKGLSVRDAFVQTKRQMAKHQDPQDWAGFVLVE